MDDFFYQAGRKAAKGVRKARWILESHVGSGSKALEAEYRVGCDLARALEASVEWDDDPAGRDLLASIHSRLTERLTNKERRWQIRLTRSDEPGAFALPGGFVYVTRPLVELCRGEADEIAWVVGHEMGHVIEGHAMERVSNEIIVSGVQKAARLSPNALSRWVLFAGANLIRSAYSQDQELSADAFGLRLGYYAGYDPRAGIRALERLRPLEAAGGSGLASYFASHPPLVQRIAALRDRIGDG